MGGLTARTTIDAVLAQTPEAEPVTMHAVRSDTTVVERMWIAFGQQCTPTAG